MSIPHFNILILHTLGAAVLCWLLGSLFAMISGAKGFRTFGVFLGLLLAVPGLLYVVYYLHALDKFAWFFQYRALPYSELAAGGMGFLPGFLAGMMRRNRTGGAAFVNTLLILVTIGLMVVPYLKPVLYPLDYDNIGSDWSGVVCTQTTEATCGPCCVATMLRDAGIESTERDLAREMYTYPRGTENWYMARALINRGFKITYRIEKKPVEELPVPSIAGVNIGDENGPGHFITILAKTKRGYIIGDPLDGNRRMSRTELDKNYHLTGFFMVVGRRMK